MKRRRILPALLLLGLPLALALAAALPKNTTVRLSLDPGGDELDGDCSRPSISGNGRFVGFDTLATDVVEGDGNASRDAFVCDTKTLLIERVSVDSSGNDANGSSSAASLSANGRYVAFESAATDLVDDDDNAQDDVFVRDRKKGVTTLASISSEAGQGDDESEDPAISGNGRYVAFESDSTIFVPGDRGGKQDVFVRDTKKAETTLVSVSSAGDQGNDHSGDPAISANGRWVVFRSDATNLADGDVNASSDVFLHDRKTGTTIIASASPEGVPQGECTGHVAISASGRYVMFNSDADGLVADDTTDQVMDTFVFDRVKGTTERVTLGPDDVQAEDSDGPGGIFNFTVALSGSGRYAAFPSAATNLVEGGTTGPQQIYVRDRKKHVTSILSLGPADVQGEGDSREAAISKSGKIVAFSSTAANLVEGDVADFFDIFARRW